jgi:hypothetical protein
VVKLFGHAIGAPTEDSTVALLPGGSDGAAELSLLFRLQI